MEVLVCHVVIGFKIVADGDIGKLRGIGEVPAVNIVYIAVLVVVYAISRNLARVTQMLAARSGCSIRQPESTTPTTTILLPVA